jgi:protein phosphatase
MFGGHNQWVEASPKSIHLGTSVSLDVAGQTHVGHERERNEDQFMIARLERNLRIEATSMDGAQQWLPGSTEGTVILVADGMGGATAGQVASSVAIQAIADYVVNVLPWADARRRAQVSDYDRPEPTLYGIRSELSKALKEGDAKVRHAAAARGAGSMGTTLTVAYLQWPHLYVAHAGDSRCYLLRNGELAQLTTDHTLAEKLRRQSEDFSIDDSSPWHHVLWNALGGGEYAKIEPEVMRQELFSGDTLLVCSDGLTKHVTHAQMTDAIRRAPRAADACNRLVELALEGGGSDNVTVVVARCRQRGRNPFDDDEPTRVKGAPVKLDETLPVTADLAAAAHDETLPDVDVPLDSDGPTLHRKK